MGGGDEEKGGLKDTGGAEEGVKDEERERGGGEASMRCSLT